MYKYCLQVNKYKKIWLGESLWPSYKKIHEGIPIKCSVQEHNKNTPLLWYMYISNLVQNSVCISCLSHAFCSFILVDVIIPVLGIVYKLQNSYVISSPVHRPAHLPIPLTQRPEYFYFSGGLLF